MTTTSFALALTGDQVIAALARPDLVGALASAGAAFAVIGADRLEGPLPRGRRTLDGAVAASNLAGRGVRGLLATAALEREHPYAIARSIATLDHHAAGTAGVVLGLHDRFSGASGSRGESGASGDSGTRGVPAARGWAGAALDDGVPLDARTLDDAGRVLQELWQSWPIDSIVADRATGVLTRADEIRRVDHAGVYDVAGPLGVPSTPQGSPVLARIVRDADGAAGLSADVDLAIVAIENPDARGRALDAVSRRASLAVFVAVDLDGDVGAAEALVAVGRCDGIVLSAAGTRGGVAALDGAASPDGAASLERLLAAARERDGGHADGTTLRERLGLPGPRPLLDDAPAAFAAPAPLR